MNFRRIIAFLLVSFCAQPLLAEPGADVEVDYNNPKKYIVGGISVAGNNYFSAQQIIQITGLQKGLELTVPSEDVSNIVRRLWLQKYFEDVSLSIDHLSEKGDSAYFLISVKERPRVSRWSFTGVKSGEKKTCRTDSICDAEESSPITWRRQAPISSNGFMQKRVSSRLLSRQRSSVTLW